MLLLHSTFATATAATWISILKNRTVGIKFFCLSLKQLNTSSENRTISCNSTKGCLHICHNSLKPQNLEDSDLRKESELGGNGNGGEERDWTTSILLLLLWGALMYYVFLLTPNQTPSRDMYFLKKLLNLIGDDGFRMNEVLVSLWYIMGLWPLVYSMILLPTGRSSESKIPVWPFLVLSCFGGAYALLPYFVFWKPPPPPVEETELRTWPLNVLQSKVTAGILLAAGLAIFIYAGIAGGEVWKEFYQYFRESKFIHITSIDFILLSSFAPFWVYNDMTARKWFDKGSWLLPLSLVPFLGPALYLFLRPSLSKSESYE
ncbi:Cardiolipin synthase N-terminal [Senna tora]|uniref:Cardiolipin synthase N-terminal n=1 Tax=Senna tora TaxID=362788 RepID=A0A834WA40_9FABA|nr:Cardiolipin synthase N-terminal [Senna tora]